MRGAGENGNASSTDKSNDLARRLRHRIIDLARKAGKIGLTINEAEAQIDDHKAHSVSPRFAELLREGLLVRVIIYRGKPTKRFRNGVPRYVTRYDEVTRRAVNVHWAPDFAPSSEPSGTDLMRNIFTDPIQNDLVGD
jgi:hypothetical protein